MPRQKKDGRYLNLYLDRGLHVEFEQFLMNGTKGGIVRHMEKNIV